MIFKNNLNNTIRFTIAPTTTTTTTAITKTSAKTPAICGIYRIYDKNGKSYIGQSVDIHKRFYNHLTGGNIPFDRLLQQSPKEFTLEIIEECSKDELDEREKYWIKFYKSKDMCYNQLPGGSSVSGENNPRALITKEDVFNIRTMYNDHVPFRDVYALYENRISKRGFQKVWHFETWRDILPEVYTEENLKWHATKAKGFAQQHISNTERQLSEEEIDEIVSMAEANFSYEDIMEATGRSKATIRRYCLSRGVSIDPKPKTLSDEDKKNIERMRSSGNENTIEISEKLNIPLETVRSYCRTLKTPQWHGNEKRIRNIETGLEFRTMKDAAKWCGKSASHFRTMVRNNKPIGEIPNSSELYHWQLI